MASCLCQNNLYLRPTSITDQLSGPSLCQHFFNTRRNNNNSAIRFNTILVDVRLLDVTKVFLFQGSSRNPMQFVNFHCLRIGHWSVNVIFLDIIHNMRISEANKTLQPTWWHVAAVICVPLCYKFCKRKYLQYHWYFCRTGQWFIFRGSCASVREHTSSSKNNLFINL